MASGKMMSKKPGCNKLISRYIKKALEAPAYLNPSYTSFSEEEGQRDYKIAVNINEMNFRGMTVTAVGNKLTSPNVKTKRNAYFTQLVMPWNNVLSEVRISLDRKSTRLNSSHQIISYAVFCLKKKKADRGAFYKYGL